MAKTKSRDWSNEVEKAVREAIAGVPGLEDLPEEAYLEHVLEGMDVIREGLEMRQQELSEEE